MRANKKKPKSQSQPPELQEYLVGDLHLLASPKDLLSLSFRRQKDERLDRLLRDFENPEKRELMLAETWVTLRFQCEYKYNNKGSPYFIVYGPRGLGKSEVAMALMEYCIESLHECTGRWALPGFGRNPSDINDLLAQATRRGIPACVQGDETENELAQGSATEEKALIDNAETARMLQPTIIRCANRLQRLRAFSYYCDFVFEVIFSDRDHEVNYCIMYFISEESGDELGRVPIGIIDFPLHGNQDLRENYEKSKKSEQVDFTSSGGRRSRIRSKLEPVVQAVVDYAKENHMTVGRGGDIEKASGLRRILIFRLRDDERGDKWNLGEQDLICDEAFERLREYYRQLPKQPNEPTEETAESAFKWASEFSWRDELARVLEKSTYRQYYRMFLATEVMGLNLYKNAEEFEKVTGRRKSAGYAWLTKMHKDDAFQGWIKETRSKLHEKFLSQKFREAGWEVVEHPRFEYQGLTYEEDLYIKKGETEYWINAKCGSGPRTYTADEYKTTFIIYNHIHAEARIIYLDLETGIHSVFLPAEHFAVGARMAQRQALDPMETVDPSTPILLSALAGPAQAEGVEESVERAPKAKRTARGKQGHSTKPEPKTRAKPEAKPRSKSKDKPEGKRRRQ